VEGGSERRAMAWTVMWGLSNIFWASPPVVSRGKEMGLILIKSLFISYRNELSIASLPLNSSPQSSQEMRSIRRSNDTQLLNPSISSSHDRAYKSAPLYLDLGKTYQQHHPSPPPSLQVRTQLPVPSYSASSVRTRAVILARIQIKI